MKPISAKYIFKAIWGSVIFTDEEQDLLLCHNDDRYDRETLQEIVGDSFGMDDLTEKQVKALLMKVSRIPTGVVVLRDLDR